MELSRAGVFRRNAREKRQYGAQVAVPNKDREDGRRFAMTSG